MRSSSALSSPASTARAFCARNGPVESAWQRTSPLPRPKNCWRAVARRFSARSPRRAMPGKLYLVGAGPGDPGLLTLKGKRCPRHADVVIYDYLANPRLLDHARPDAVRLLVGKHGGGTRVAQDVITHLIIEHAQRGKTVVRLKGGDPFVFGRGGEEAEAAQAAGIDFEIVPGVTSAVAGPASAGIPLTHRELASSVIFTTGYEYPTKTEMAVHWSELARSGSTLVILMTQRQARAHMRPLIAGGLAADTPVAVIQWGTRADQSTSG